MKFEDLPMGSCFKGRGRKIHRKNGPDSYLADGVGPEAYPSPRRRVRAVACPVSRTLVELGSVRPRRNRRTK